MYGIMTFDENGQVLVDTTMQLGKLLFAQFVESDGSVTDDRIVGQQPFVGAIGVSNASNPSYWDLGTFSPPILELIGTQLSWKVQHFQSLNFTGIVFLGTR